MAPTVVAASVVCLSGCGTQWVVVVWSRVLSQWAAPEGTPLPGPPFVSLHLLYRQLTVTPRAQFLWLLTASH